MLISAIPKSSAIDSVLAVVKPGGFFSYLPPFEHTSFISQKKPFKSDAIVMEGPVDFGEDPEIQVQLTLLAASRHDLQALRTLLEKGSPSVQDPDTGFTPLHTAIAACETDGDTPPRSQETQTNSNGPEVGSESPQEPLVETAEKTMRLLLQNGAIWNDVDKQNETPGCLALRLGFQRLYEIMVDAGVRAEMLLNRLDEYQQLVDADSEDEEPDSATEQVDQELEVIGDGHAESAAGQTSAGDLQRNGPQSDEYLQSSLRFQRGRILDDNSNGVMMAWESDIMKRTAEVLVPSSNLRILNIGHGMGIIDEFFQSKFPSTHHIIEAHPSVCAHMRERNWHERPNVVVHEGRWQDIVPKLMAEGVMFDAIYFDTFAEDYKALRDFFSDSVIGLLDDGGKWGFFHGLGADRQICYDVYTKIVEMDLFEAGFDVEWETIHVPPMDDNEWEGVKRRYWALKEYRLPVCSFTQS